MRLATKLENRKLEMKPTNFDLSQLVKKVVENLGGEWENREVELNLESCPIFADKTFFELVLINLIENGLKYSTQNVVVKVTKESLQITDFGDGIEKSEFQNIQKKFYRVSQKRDNQSLGLGLSIVSYILKLHNLELKIDSKLGKGST